MFSRNEFLRWLGIRKRADRCRYELDEALYTALEDLALKEQRPPQEIHAELLASALAQRHTLEALWERWLSLSPREQEVAALTCLGYTNRQIAARLRVAPDTVKGYVRQVLVKFSLHGKSELQLSLASWDFSDWGPTAQR